MDVITTHWVSSYEEDFFASTQVSFFFFVLAQNDVVLAWTLKIYICPHSCVQRAVDAQPANKNSAFLRHFVKQFMGTAKGHIPT